MAKPAVRATRKRGRPAFGYTFKANTPTVIVEAQARIVRLMFALRADGASTAAIATALNARGHRGAMGGPWRYQSVALCLAYPLYRGEPVNDRTDEGGAGRRLVDPGALRIVDPATCARIDAFEAAARREDRTGRCAGPSKSNRPAPSGRSRKAEHERPDIPRPPGRRNRTRQESRP